MRHTIMQHQWVKLTVYKQGEHKKLSRKSHIDVYFLKILTESRHNTLQPKEKKINEYDNNKRSNLHKIFKKSSTKTHY